MYCHLLKPEDFVGFPRVHHCTSVPKWDRSKWMGSAPFPERHNLVGVVEREAWSTCITFFESLVVFKHFDFLPLYLGRWYNFLAGDTLAAGHPSASERISLVTDKSKWSCLVIRNSCQEQRSFKRNNRLERTTSPWWFEHILTFDKCFAAGLTKKLGPNIQKDRYVVKHCGDTLPKFNSSPLKSYIPSQ